MVVAALDHLITAAEFAPGLEDVDGFAYDLVDVARQAFMDAGVDMYRKVSWDSPGVSSKGDLNKDDPRLELLWARQTGDRDSRPSHWGSAQRRRYDTGHQQEFSPIFLDTRRSPEF